MSAPALLFLGGLLIVAGVAVGESTARTRGQGSWAEDRRRLMVAGALYAIAAALIGISFAEVIAP